MYNTNIQYFRQIVTVTDFSYTQSSYLFYLRIVTLKIFNTFFEKKKLCYQFCQLCILTSKIKNLMFKYVYV